MSREGYKMTELGEIPQEWEIKTIEEVCDSVDYRGKTPEKVENGIFLVTAKNIGKGFINYRISKEYVSEEAYGKVMSRGLPKKGDVLLTTEAPLGNVANVDNENIALAQRVIKFRGKEGILDNYYLKHYMLGDIFQKELVAQATGSTVLGIKGSRLKKLNVVIPPLPEQQKIADILSTIDQRIEQTDALIEKTKELKKGLMQKLLTKGIGHTEFRDTEIGRIPKEWEVKRLVEVSDINPESLSSKTDPNFVLKYIDIESVTTGKINGTKEFCFAEAPSRARRIVVYNDVIISTVRPYLKAFAIVKTDEDNMICSTGFAVIRAINNNNPDFLFQYTLSDCFINQLSNKMVGSNYPAVNASDVKESLIAVPPINEQKRIAQVLSEFDIQINELEDKTEKLRILKSGLMDKLLTGRVRVKI